MAAGGAAPRSGWKAGPSGYDTPEPSLSPIYKSWLTGRSVAPAGTPVAFRKRTTYTTPSGVQGNGGPNGATAQQLAHIRGPGVVTSFSFQAIAVASVGFQMLNVKAGSGASPMLQPTAGAYWIQGQNGAYGSETTPQSTNPNMLDGFVYPVQEIAYAAASYAEYIDTITSIGYPLLVTTTGSTSSPAFTQGQVLNFQSAFANGYATIGPVGTISAPAAAWGAVAQVRYTLYGSFPFDDELYVSLSTVVVDSALVAIQGTARVDVSFTYSNLGAG